MKKIPTIFKRNPDNMRELLNEPHPDCDWVFKGEGIATRKYDGTCVMIKGHRYFKRREVKKNGEIPHGFIEETFDPITGKRVGWLEVDPAENENKYHMEAFEDALPRPIHGTYELVGPKIQKNPERYPEHRLVSHSLAQEYEGIERTYEGISKWLEDKDIEGIVFHHPDGKMAKIKKRDFGQKRVVT